MDAVEAKRHQLGPVKVGGTTEVQIAFGSPTIAAGSTDPEFNDNNHTPTTYASSSTQTEPVLVVKVDAVPRSVTEELLALLHASGMEIVNLLLLVICMLRMCVKKNVAKATLSIQNTALQTKASLQRLASLPRTISARLKVNKCKVLIVKPMPMGQMYREWFARMKCELLATAATRPAVPVHTLPDPVNRCTTLIVMPRSIYDMYMDWAFAQLKAIFEEAVASMLAKAAITEAADTEQLVDWSMAGLPLPGPTTSFIEPVAFSLDEAALQWELEWHNIDWGAKGVPQQKLAALDFSAPGVPCTCMDVIDWSPCGIPAIC